MIHMIADDLPLSTLAMLVEPAVIYDPTGTRVIGHFTPVDLERGKRLYAELEARIDPEELARRLSSCVPGCTLEEIKAKVASRVGATAAERPPTAPQSAGSDECATP